MIDNVTNETIEYLVQQQLFQFDKIMVGWPFVAPAGYLFMWLSSSPPRSEMSSSGKQKPPDMILPGYCVGHLCTTVTHERLEGGCRGRIIE